MTLIARTSTEPREVLSIFKNPVFRVEERAPNVYDARMPNDRLDGLVEKSALFRRIDLSGIVFGLPVPSADSQAQLVVALYEPLSGEQRTELRNTGMLIRREGFGNVSGEAAGSSLAELALLEWIGPIQIKRVSMASNLPAALRGGSAARR